MRLRNKTLYHKIRKFVIASLTLIRKNYQSSDDLARFYEHVRRYSINGDGISWDDSYQIDVFHLIFSMSKDIEQLPEFVDCAKYFLKNPIARAAHGWRTENGQPSTKLPLQLNYFRPLTFFLDNMLRQTDVLSFNEEIFIELYLFFEKSIYKKTIRQKITASLRNFSSDVDEIHFGNGFKIRKITDAEKIQLYQRMDLPFSSPPFNIWDIQKMQYTLEVIRSRNKSELYLRSEESQKGPSIQDIFNDIVTTLRLFKPGGVSFSSVDTISLDWTPQIGSFSSSSSLLRQTRAPSYTLAKDEVDDLLRLWRRYKKFEKLGSKRNKYVKLALQRLSSTTVYARA
jgi:hypothetical protein